MKATPIYDDTVRKLGDPFEERPFFQPKPKPRKRKKGENDR